MHDDPHDSVRSKVQTIFNEMAGDRALVLEPGKFPAGICTTVTAALSKPDATDEQILRADQLAFHLVDWSSDAAFLVALHLFPERFTPDEIKAAVDMFIAHVPAHVWAAARLSGHSTADLLAEENDRVT